MPKASEEIALGQEAALSLSGAVDLYDHAALAELVTRVGKRVASGSERPELPWSFAVIDDPTPNAFALPGGSVYVTRGLLAHLNSESELAAVLAHEIAHITARHGVRKLQRLARTQHRTGRSSIESQLPNVRAMGSLGASRFLEHQRDEELLADELALRYLKRADFDPVALSQVLETLGALHGGPGYENPRTHPTTVHRRAQIHSQLQRQPDSPDVDLEYLETIDGMMFGPDPREGYFKDGAFVHPRMGFMLQLPEHWTVEYRNGHAVAKNPKGDTLLTVSESAAESVRAGMNEVFLHDVQKKDPWKGQLRGHPAAVAEFSTTVDERPINALVGFVEFEGKIIQVVAFSTAASWPAKQTRTAFKSFAAAPVALVKVDPMTVDVAEIKPETTLRRDYERNPSSVPLAVIARINHVDPDSTLPASRPLKRVRGFNPDFASVR